MLLGLFQLLHLLVMFFPWFLTLPPRDGSWVHLLSSPLVMSCELDAPAHHGSSSLIRAAPQAVQGQAAAQDPQRKLVGEGIDRAECWLKSRPVSPPPPPRWIGTAPREESADHIDFTGKWIAYWIARSSTSAMHVCSGLFLGLCISCLCILKDCLMVWGWTVDQGSLAFSSQMFCLSEDKWGLMELWEMPAKALCV